MLGRRSVPYDVREEVRFHISNTSETSWPDSIDWQAGPGVLLRPRRTRRPG